MTLPFTVVDFTQTMHIHPYIRVNLDLEWASEVAWFDFGRM
jgi:membrane-bound lytic murein transglycosylase MltF